MGSLIEILIALMDSNGEGEEAIHTFTIVISTPARCKIGAAFFSNRLLAFLGGILRQEVGNIRRKMLSDEVLRFLASYPLQAAGFKITVAFLRCSCGAIC